MADLKVIKGHGELTCVGLGSCIGLCALDPIAAVAGMVHVVLPETLPDKEGKPGKFADTAVPALVKELEAHGADRNRIVFAMAGGAQVFKFGDGSEVRLDIGTRNADAVRKQVESLNLPILGTDVGGNLARTLLLKLETGAVIVRTVTQGESSLCNLRGRP